MKKNMSYENRLKKMKASIEVNKSELSSGKMLSDDVTYLGSPKIVKSNEGAIEPIPEEEKKNDS
jgi:hypothetical protein